MKNTSDEVKYIEIPRKTSIHVKYNELKSHIGNGRISHVGYKDDIRKTLAESREEWDAWEKDLSLQALFTTLKGSESRHRLVISAKTLYSIFETGGIYIDSDPRFEAVRNQILSRASLENEDVLLGALQFKSLIDSARDVLMKTLRKELAVPEFPSFSVKCRTLFQAADVWEDGEMSQSLAYLKRQDPNVWEGAMCSIDGQRLMNGKCSQKFAIGINSKPFIYALALELLGPEFLEYYVGFNFSHYSNNDPSFKKTIKYKTRSVPLNPMILGGTIVICSLIKNVALKDIPESEKFERVQLFFKKLAGAEGTTGGTMEKVGFNNFFLISLTDYHMTHASLCYYLKNKKCFPEDSDPIRDLEFYYQVCSIEVNCNILCKMGATLANYGVCPFTYERVVTPECARHTLAAMRVFTQGNKTGSWNHSAGLPCTFGWTGASLLVVPGVLSYSVISRKLTDHHHSLKALVFFKALSDTFDFHPYTKKKEEFEDSGEGENRPYKYGEGLKCLYTCELFASVYKGDVINVARLLLNDYKACDLDFLDRSVLHAAVASGKLEMVKYLVKHCPHILFLRDSMNCTAADDALTFGYECIHEFLIQKMSEPDASLCTFNNTKCNGKRFTYQLSSPY